jgi:hypothetical protein
VFSQGCAKWSTPTNPTIGRDAASALQEVIANAPDQLSGYPQFLNPDQLSGIGMVCSSFFA